MFNCVKTLESLENHTKKAFEEIRKKVQQFIDFHINFLFGRVEMHSQHLKFFSLNVCSNNNNYRP